MPAAGLYPVPKSCGPRDTSSRFGGVGWAVRSCFWPPASSAVERGGFAPVKVGVPDCGWFVSFGFWFWFSSRGFCGLFAMVVAPMPLAAWGGAGMLVDCHRAGRSWRGWGRMLLRSRSD